MAIAQEDLDRLRSMAAREDELGFLANMIRALLLAQEAQDSYRREQQEREA